MTTIKCAICGTEFEVPDNRYRLYCSKKCAKKAEHLKGKEKREKLSEEKRIREAQKGINLDNALKLADGAGLSYGQYMAQKYIDEHRMNRGGGD